jgi:6-phosphogluconolactonase/glucosamine-6-phosphate isomerase/deaminase
MGFSLKTTTKIEEATDLIVSSILSQLKSSKQVLFFVTGGSSIAICVKVAELLRNNPEQDLTKNLTIMMTDERYGPLDHKDSNWYQLMQKGFSLPQARLLPILDGDDRVSTTLKFNTNLSQELMKDKETMYKIGLFGVGADGHTSGILPESDAVKSEDFACSYNTPTFSRITTTFKTIEKLDEAVAWIQGENKWWVIKDLLEKNIDVAKQPAQILKKVPISTIFSDFKIGDGKQ